MQLVRWMEGWLLDPLCDTLIQVEKMKDSGRNDTRLWHRVTLDYTGKVLTLRRASRW